MTSRKRAYAQVGAVLAGCALLAACTPAAAPPSPTPTPSPVAPTPTETDQQRQERLAYEGAEKAYRTFITEYGRIVSKSDQPKPTPLLKKNAAGPYLNAYEGFLKERRSERLRSSGVLKIGYVTHDGFSPKEVLLTSCEDGSGVVLIDRSGKRLTAGEIGTIQLTVRLIAGHWKVWDGNHEKKVTVCAS